MKKALLLTALLSVAAASQAATLTIDLNGLQSFDRYGDANNTVLFVPVGANAIVNGVGWDLGISTIGESYISEAAIDLNNTDNNEFDAIYFNPGFEYEDSGSESFSSGGVLDFPFDIQLAADGLLRVELYEDFDDNVNLADATYSGFLTVQYETQAVPEPASMAALGFGALALLRRRRKSA
ncbi:PEP-CTERM sorting domain-containing protein [bacterium]|nr:MAG: PEP-CTERM sorting domain-containing protein [bacterium]